APAASYFGRRLRSLAAVELFPNYLALKAHIGFLPCVVYGSLTFDQPLNRNGTISIGTYLALQADRDALQLQVRSTETAYQQLLSELEAVGLEKENIEHLIKINGKVSDRSEATYLQRIGAMRRLLLGHSPSGKPHSVGRSQAASVDALTDHYDKLPGIAKRNLDEKFAAAKRSLSER
ncbi:hypothetical protein, partial [Pseudomonas gessardii]|uniref:hypothetical protein n=1 Tax=Pseudomonas gessardii TaxID=78544 RepID=UPI0022A68A95